MSKSRTLAVIAVSCLMVLAGAGTWAQSEDREDCIDACEQAKEACIDRCDTHENPIECDEDCQNAEVDCIHLCR